jgi:hypothetical protein
MKRCNFSTVSNHSNQYICQICRGMGLLSWSMLETCIVKENVQYKAQDIYKYIASSLPSFDNFLQLLLHRHGGPTAPEPAVARFSPSIVVVTFKSFFFPREGKLFHADISSSVLNSKRYRRRSLLCVFQCLFNYSFCFPAIDYDSTVINFKLSEI